MSVYIENQSHVRFDFQYKVMVRKAVQFVMEYKDIPEELDVNVLIVTPEKMQEINKDARGIDSVTDVLSFPYFEYDTPGVFDREKQDWSDEDILGDIVICAERVISQAQEYGHSQKREMTFLTVHSMLHLVGYDHMEDADRELMEAEQRVIMDQLGVFR